LEFSEQSITFETSLLIDSTFHVTECTNFLLLNFLFDSFPFTFQGRGRFHIDPKKQKPI
jgi:hypothetical protein